MNRKPKRITPPLTDAMIDDMHAGDEILLSGLIYTARDAAHLRFFDLLEAGKRLPLDLDRQVLYYTGPTPSRPGRPSGSMGPTTSNRMDPFTPRLLKEAGLKGMIGKGPRSPHVIEAIRETNSVYFAAIGGAGALLGTCVRKQDIVCYPDLGTEAVRCVEVENMPLIVAVDCRGNDLYKRE